MWMDAYVHDVLIRQQIADSDRTAAMRHAVRAARMPRAPRRWPASIQRFVVSVAAACLRRPAARVAVR
jgi:hypothetical protein